MQERTSPRDRTEARTTRTHSELASLVETEARLDRELAGARASAARLIEEANARVDAAAASQAAQLAAARARIAAETEAAAAARIRELDEACARDVARLAGVRDERADAIARTIADQLVAFVLAEDTP